MFIKQEMYNGKMTDILYPDEGYLLEHKETKLIYGSVSLEDGRKQEDYNEIPEPQPEPEDVDGIFGLN